LADSLALDGSGDEKPVPGIYFDRMRELDPHLTSTFPASRLSTSDVGRRGLRKHYMFSLLEVDVTAARSSARSLRKAGIPVSLTAWIIKAASNAVTANKGAHAMRLGRRRLVIFEDVDVAIPIERTVQGTGVPLPFLIRATNRKTVENIQQELDMASGQTVTGEKDYILGGHGFSGFILKLYYRLPQWARLLALRAVLDNPFRAKRNSGTLLVTTVNATGKSAGWILPTRSLHNLSVCLGSVTKKPWVVAGKVEARDILHLTVTFDHDVIDGVPARRFVQYLVDQIESGVLKDTLG
jgi:hypothetical protein